MSPAERVLAVERYTEFTRLARLGFPKSLLEIAPTSLAARQEWLKYVIQFVLDDTTCDPLTTVDPLILRDRIGNEELPEERRRELLSLVDEYFTTASAASPPDATSNQATEETITPPRFPRIPGVTPVQQLGMGGGGIVYEAIEHAADQTQHIAVKVMRLHTISSQPEVRERMLRRFLREYTILKSLKHPNIISVFKFGNDDDYFYYTMPLLRGGTLRDRIPVLSPLSWEELKDQFLAMFNAIGEAIHTAHQQPIIHRDIKPANILFDELGIPYVSDFGIARILGEETIGDAATVLGTPGFTAPEAINDPQQADERSDIYSLGQVIHSVLYGNRPKDTTSYRLRTDSLPSALIAIVTKCLHIDPQQRYQSVRQLLDALGEISTPRPDHARVDKPVPAPTPIAKTSRSRRVASLALGVICIGGIAFVSLKNPPASLPTASLQGLSPLAEFRLEQPRLQQQIDDLEFPYNNSTAATRAQLRKSLETLALGSSDLLPNSPEERLARLQYLRMCCQFEIAGDESSATTSDRCQQAQQLIQSTPWPDALKQAVHLEDQWLLLISATLAKFQSNSNEHDRLSDTLRQQLEHPADSLPSSFESYTLELRVRQSLLDRAFRKQDALDVEEQVEKTLALLDRCPNPESRTSQQWILATLEQCSVVFFKQRNLERCEQMLARISDTLDEIVVQRALEESQFYNNSLVDYYASFADNLQGAIYLRKAETAANPQELYQQAESCFIKAIDRRQRLVEEREYRPELAKALSDSLANLGNVYRHKGEWDRALKIANDQVALFASQLAKAPNDVTLQRDKLNATYRLAQLHLQRESPQETLRLMDRSLQEIADAPTELRLLLASDAANHYALRAESKMQMQQYDTAVLDWDLAIENCAKQLRIPYRISRGQCLVAIGASQRALDEFNSIDPTNLGANNVYNLATGYALYLAHANEVTAEQAAEVVTKFQQTASALSQSRDRNDLLNSNSVKMAAAKYGPAMLNLDQ